MWETDWVELLRETKPRGIIFMMDHNHPYHHKDALNFVMQLIEEEAVATQNLQHIMVMVNKSDLWADDMTLDELLDDYRNEVRRLKSQAERVGYTYTIMPTSLMTGENIEAALSTFFNAIRPRAERAAS
jgi:translation elongation factor EF-1alpha